MQWFSHKVAQVLNFLEDQSLESLELTVENVGDLVVLADFLDIQDIVDECSEFMVTRISEENVCELWQFSQVYRMTKIQQECLRSVKFISTRSKKFIFSFLCQHFKSVCHLQEFQLLSFADVNKILLSGDSWSAWWVFSMPCVGKFTDSILFSYDDVWHGITKWCSGHKSRLSDFKEMSKHVLFCFLEDSFYNSQVKTSWWFRTFVQEDDLPREQLLVFGGDSRDSRAVVAYNSLTDSWRRLTGLMPEPGLAPGDKIQAVTCGDRVFLKRSVNCWMMDWRHQTFTFIGTFEVTALMLTLQLFK